MNTVELICNKCRKPSKRFTTIEPHLITYTCFECSMNTLEQANKRIELLETQLKRMKEQELLLVNANKELRKQLDENIEDNPRYKFAVEQLNQKQLEYWQDKIKAEAECEKKTYEARKELNKLKLYFAQLRLDDGLTNYMNTRHYDKD